MSMMTREQVERMARYLPQFVNDNMPEKLLAHDQAQREELVREHDANAYANHETRRILQQGIKDRDIHIQKLERELAALAGRQP